MKWEEVTACSEELSETAAVSLIEEAALTPKPGLVDKSNTGAHTDLDYNIMALSAVALKSTFRDIAETSFNQPIDQSLREKIAVIGRHGEKTMLQATGGVNTHKGAIWALGLLTAAAASLNKSSMRAEDIALTAGKLAQFQDRRAAYQETNGSRVKQYYGTRGAKEEAQQGFPHVTLLALPVLYDRRRKQVHEDQARLDALLSVMSSLDDSCLLHRGGKNALQTAKRKSLSILKAGGVSAFNGYIMLQELDRELIKINASPGGSADMLAAALFLDHLIKSPLHLSNAAKKEMTI
ncbi:triphosphoribosyl-dephospho-CoA synthase [Alteribacillus sp. YIM 98480]|uniref:triphosphoribosyl-dephospho-CoA synthase n=1 Tax=Alteribacillus sp. YIM 98480 TaxID=2606599 RepID=UPI00131C6FEE|nr:triphosphoribosyl-dephospho-CoA synthase [Alteribacillus sp. YIM 98480]